MASNKGTIYYRLREPHHTVALQCRWHWIGNAPAAPIWMSSGKHPTKRLTSGRFCFYGILLIKAALEQDTNDRHIPPRNLPATL